MAHVHKICAMVYGSVDCGDASSTKDPTMSRLEADKTAGTVERHRAESEKKRGPDQLFNRGQENL